MYNWRGRREEEDGMGMRRWRVSYLWLYLDPKFIFAFHQVVLERGWVWREVGVRRGGGGRKGGRGEEKGWQSVKWEKGMGRH